MTVPNYECQIIKGCEFIIVDFPGIENYYWSSKIEQYLEKFRETVVPLFVLDLTQGAFDLAQFNYIKTLFRNTYGLKIPFVFTKFNNLLNDVMTKLETSGALEDLPFEEV